jgi:hypothetical protein
MIQRTPLVPRIGNIGRLLIVFAQIRKLFILKYTIENIRVIVAKKSAGIAGERTPINRFL